MCCQASWDSGSSATIGDDGWDEAIGAASLERLHALEPDRALCSHDADEWHQTG